MDHAGLLDPVLTTLLLLLLMPLSGRHRLSCSSGSQDDDAHHHHHHGGGPRDSGPSSAELMQSQTFTDMEKLMKDFRRYNSMIRPNYRDGPTIVNVSMTVKNIASFDVSNMEYKMTIFLVRQWMDHRLHLRRKWSGREGYIDVPNAAAGHLWRPTVFFNNEKNSVVHSVTAPNTMLKVYNDSRVLYSMRITLTLSCPMYIQNYPWDIQFCPMTLTSASYTANEMFLQWDKDERRMIAKDISILPLVVENITLSDNCTYTEIIGNLSCLNITFKLCRRMSASDIQMYVSSGLLSGLSCIAFLIPVDKTPARAGIGITTTISVITQCANAHANMPKVSYMTAMDIWMTGCLSFIVCTFIVNILETSFCHNKKDNSAQTEGVGQTQADEEDPSHSGSAAAQDDDENRGGEPPIASSCDRLGAAVGCLKKVLRAIFCKHKLFVLSLFIFSTLIIIYFVLNNKC